ncbi:MAG: Holliday junction branch migration protein RuvA [Planctomycetota bacterium]
MGSYSFCEVCGLVIARIAGRLEEVSDTAALIDVGAGVWYEVLIPACDIERLSRRIGQDVILHTIHYLEGDPSHGAISPRLVGFASESDRDFFRLFTTVKGIGVRKALRSMVRPVAEVAAAIQVKDTKLLVALPEIGKRTAETVIAELHGKVEQFAGPAATAGEQKMPEVAEEAAAVLVQLGERRADALALVQRVLSVAPELESPEAILQHVYKLKAGATGAQEPGARSR